MATNHPTVPHPPLQQEAVSDYVAHEKTYNGFIAAVKYSLISLAILAVGLYFSIIGGQPILGIVLILASLIVPAIMAIVGRR
jgi:hypothetical protein